MKKMILPVLLVCALALTSISADARRMGGGKSFGRQSPNVTQRDATPSPAPASPTQNASSAAGAKPGAAAAAPAKRPWGGMLGGLAAGLGLAWLAHSLGLGAAFGNILLIALLAFAALAAWRFFSAKSRAGQGAARNGLAYGTVGGPGAPVAPPEYSPKNVGNDASARPWERSATAFDTAGAGGGSLIGSALGGNQSWGVPAGFDTEGFLAAAKRNFVTLQDAWDRNDVAMLRSMMTDDMVGEIRSQLAERESHTGGQDNKTDVVTLEAQLLGIEELPDVYLASVEFSGVIREDASAGPSPFREVWNMTKPTDGKGGWLVAGVQALQ